MRLGATSEPFVLCSNGRCDRPEPIDLAGDGADSTQNAGNQPPAQLTFLRAAAYSKLFSPQGMFGGKMLADVFLWVSLRAVAFLHVGRVVRRSIVGWKDIDFISSQCVSMYSVCVDLLCIDCRHTGVGDGGGGP